MSLVHQHQHRRGPWSAHEDQQLLQLVHVHGAHNWVRISQLVGTRSPKQCRERFHQNLKPQLNHDPITPEEGELIERLVNEMGKRWAEIARHLNGRSDNAVKNWWNGGVNRRRRLSVRQRMENRAQEDRRRRAEESIHSMPQYAMSHCGQPTLGVLVPPRRQQSGENALPSPPLSTTMSRADSKEPTPSLVSDSPSYLSASPRMPESPMSIGGNTLPPLQSYHGHQHHGSHHTFGSYSFGGPNYDRRPSLPTSYEPYYNKPSYPYHAQQYEQSAPRYTPINPPLTPTHPTAPSSEAPGSPKDTRMNISNLCS